MILCQRLPTIHEDVVFEKILVAGQYTIVKGLKKGGGRRPASTKNRMTIQSSSRPNIEDFYRKSAELVNKSNAVGLGSSLPRKVKTSFSSEGGNTIVEVKSKDFIPKPEGGRNDQQLGAQENLAIFKPIVNDVEDKRNNHQVEKLTTLRFAPDMEKNAMSDADYKVKLRQQYQANMEKFAKKEIEKEKVKERESATEHISKEKENKFVSVELEQTNDKNGKQKLKTVPRKGVQDEEKKNAVEKEVVYRIIGFGSVDHISRKHKDRGTDAKKTQTHYTPPHVKTADRPGSSQSILKDRQLERRLLSFKQNPVASKHVPSVDKKELEKTKTEPASLQKQTTGMQQNMCNLPRIRPGPKKVSWADPQPRQTCTVKPVPRGENRTGLPTSTNTQRNPPTPKAFLTAIPNNTSQIKRYFHAPYQLSNSKLPKR